MPTIYRFKVYNIQNDESQLSRRWGTLTGIQAARGTPLMETATEADASVLSREVEGLTDRDFDPNPRPSGFQREVRTTQRSG